MREDPDQIARMSAHFHAVYETAVNLTTLYPGAEATLRALKADGFKTGPLHQQARGPDPRGPAPLAASTRCSTASPSATAPTRANPIPPRCAM